MDTNSPKAIKQSLCIVEHGGSDFRVASIQGWTVTVGGPEATSTSQTREFSMSAICGYSFAGTSGGGCTHVSTTSRICPTGGSAFPFAAGHEGAPRTSVCHPILDQAA